MVQQHVLAFLSNFKCGKFFKFPNLNVHHVELLHWLTRLSWIPCWSYNRHKCSSNLTMCFNCCTGCHWNNAPAITCRINHHTTIHIRNFGNRLILTWTSTTFPRSNHPDKIRVVSSSNVVLLVNSVFQIFQILQNPDESVQVLRSLIVSKLCARFCKFCKIRMNQE